jgi:adenosylmethionine-8-amino-7-oxononanoate aminotransferase
MPSDNTFVILPPFASDNHYERIAFPAIKGEGAYLVDENGRRCFDAISGMWNVPLGYTVPRLLAALTKQANELPAASLTVATSPVTLAFARKLLSLSGIPSLSRGFLSSGGAEAVETAIKLARHYYFLEGRKGKHIVLSFGDSYHGLTYGALSVTGIADDRAPYGPLVQDIHPIGSAKAILQGAEGTAGLTQSFIDAFHHFGEQNIAAVIFEPVFGVAGMIEIPPLLRDALVELRRQHDFILIADEVTTGMGRSGELLWSTKLGIVPDLVVMGKALSNGWQPLSAVLVADWIAEACRHPKNGAFMHGYTFGGNPLASAVGCETLAILEESYLGKPLHEFAALLNEAASRALLNHKHVRTLRVPGAFAAVDLEFNGVDNEKAMELATRIRIEARNRGVIVRPTYGGRTFNFVPMFISTKHELDFLFEAFGQSLSHVLG